MSEVAREKLRSQPDETALEDERTTLTWAALDPLLNRITNGLLAAGLGAKRVGVMSTNSVEAMLAHLGALQAGVSSVPISFHLTADEVAHILEDSGCAMLFVGSETMQAGLGAARKAGTERVIGWRCEAQQGLIDWDGWLRDQSEDEAPADMPPRPHLHYTSGTTGKPKGVETPPSAYPLKPTVAAQLALFRTLESALPDRSPNLIVSPLYHTGPMGAVRALAGGQAQIMQTKFDAEDVLRLIDRKKVKTTLMVPTHFQRLLSLPEEIKRRYDVSSLVRVSHTGASCPLAVKEQMIAWFGPVLVEAYGATESGTTNLISSEEWLRKPGSVGRTQPPFELLIVGDDGQEMAVGKSGQVFFRDTTGRGVVYYQDEDKTRAAHLSPGVFTLGDVGHVDEDGYLFITDRVSDMIVSGGVNIYPAEAEQVLMTHSAVADIAIVAVPNADMGEEAKALVVLVADGAVTADQLDQFCRQHLAGFKCPRTYEFVDHLGRNMMGKISKKALRQRFWPSDRTIGG